MKWTGSRQFELISCQTQQLARPCMYVTQTPATGQPRSRVTNPPRTKITRLVNPDQVLQTGQKGKSSKFYNIAWHSIYLGD